MSLMITMMMTTWMKITKNLMTKMKVLQWKSHQTQNFQVAEAFVVSDCASVDSAVLFDSVYDLDASLDVDVVDKIENLVVVEINYNNI